MIWWLLKRDKPVSGPLNQRMRFSQLMLRLPWCHIEMHLCWHLHGDSTTSGRNELPVFFVFLSLGQCFSVPWVPLLFLVLIHSLIKCGQKPWPTGVMYIYPNLCKPEIFHAVSSYHSWDIQIIHYFIITHGLKKVTDKS